MAQINYIVDSNFHPFSFQERLAPYLLYDKKIEEADAKIEDLASKLSDFSYLEDVLQDNPDDQAGQIYKKYADDFKAIVDDYDKNGLYANNENALRNLRRRYFSEIGKLQKANTERADIIKMRRQSKDNSMIYATDTEDLGLSGFLNGNTPNLYGISGNELYSRGAEIGKNFSMRAYEAGKGSPLGGYFTDFVIKRGYTPTQLAMFQNEILNDFSKEVSVLPELQDAAASVLKATGAYDNLDGNKLRMAQLQVVRGIVDNAIYDEKHSVNRNPGVMTPYQQMQYKNWENKLNGKSGGNSSNSSSTSSSSSGSGSSKKGRIAGYTGTDYVYNSGNSVESLKPKTNENLDISTAYRVRTQKEDDGSYVVYLDGLGKDKGTLGRISNGSVDIDVYKDKYKDMFNYKEKYDDENIKALLRDIYHRMNDEGEDGYRNYEYFFEPKDSSKKKGGFYRRPLQRVMRTSVSNSEEDFDSEEFYDDTELGYDE